MLKSLCASAQWVLELFVQMDYMLDSIMEIGLMLGVTSHFLESIGNFNRQQSSHACIFIRILCEVCAMLPKLNEEHPQLHNK